MSKLKWDMITMPGKEINEDIAYVSENMAWVLDSATGLTDKKLTTEGSDGAWLVKMWDKYLKKELHNTKKSLSNIIEDGIDIIREEFYKEVKLDYVESIQRPSESVAILRVNNTYIEYFLLGDCTLLIKKKDNKVIKVKDYRLEKLDDTAIEYMNIIRKKNNLTFLQAREAINDRLIKNRLLKNTKDGYWTLEFNKEAIQNAISDTIKIKEVKSIAIMSDGYSAIFDKYKYCTESELMELLENTKAEEIYKIIRKIENEDSEILKYPRFKKGDDSSIVFYKFE